MPCCGYSTQLVRDHKSKDSLLNVAGPQKASEKFDCYPKIGKQNLKKIFFEPAPGGSAFFDFFKRLKMKTNSKKFDQVKTVWPILGPKIK